MVEIKRELSLIDSLGGALEGIHSGYQVEKIEANAFDIARRIEEGSSKIIGLNFGISENTTSFTKEFFDATENRVVEVFQIYKASRNSIEVESSLAALLETVSRAGTLLPGIKDCLLVGATVGEI